MSDQLHLARRALSEGDWVRAEALCAGFLEEQPGHAEALALQAQTILASGDSARALPALRKLATVMPNDPWVMFQIGHALKSTGAADEAHEAFLEVLAVDPNNVPAIVSLTQVRRYKERDSEIALIEKRFSQSAAGSEDRRHLAFALGKAFNDIGDFDRSFRYLEEGNCVARGGIASTVRDDEAMFELVRTSFDARFAGKYRRCAINDESPVFVFGMPRSGTTLVHQIIASHSDAFGGGEMPYMQRIVEGLVGGSSPGRAVLLNSLDETLLRERMSAYLRDTKRLRGDASVIVDKAISNLLFVGFIGTLLPRAKLISCRRDPRDVCWSIFRRDIPAQEYGFDLARLGRNYQLYVELLNHWEAILPGRIFTIQYEDLVNAPEQKIRQLIAFCGLPFEASCLDFHRSRAAVNTQSTLQVRERIHSGAIGQWRNYARQLAPLLDVLDRNTD